MDVLCSSSPVPSTPLTNRIKSYSHSRNTHKPLNSSPLVQDSVSPFSSPVAEAQARRQSQYKTRIPSGSSRTRNVSGSHYGSLGAKSAASSSSAASVTDSQKVMLRDRFKMRCLQRAEKARARALASRRRSDPSSDGFDEVMDDDVEETDEDIIQSDFYHRIVLNQAYKERHAYRRAYYADVGSSFDPDLEDITAWEHELDTSGSTSAEPVDQPSTEDPEEAEMTPEELEQAELEAYAAECERQAAFADFEDIPVDELFEDIKTLEEEIRQSGGGLDDIEMDFQV